MDEAKTTVILRGTCSWWDTVKGFGFLTPETSGQRDVFVHRTALKQSGIDWHDLRVGQEVAFELGHGPDGRECAVNLEVIR